MKKYMDFEKIAEGTPVSKLIEIKSDRGCRERMQISNAAMGTCMFMKELQNTI